MWKEEDAIVDKILKTRSLLDSVYSSDLDVAFLAFIKDSLFLDLKDELCAGNCAGIYIPKTNGEDFEFNNAYLVSIDTYYSLVPVFQSIFNSLNGNFQKFFEKVEELGDLSFEERQREIESLQNKIVILKGKIIKKASGPGMPAELKVLRIVKILK